MKKKMEKSTSEFFRGAGPTYNSPFLQDLRKTLVRDDSISPEEFNDFVSYGYIFAYQYIPLDILKQIIMELTLADKIINKFMD